MNSRSSSRPGGMAAGFTLVEMLVAVAIMSLMMLVMARLTGMAEQISRAEQDRQDNYSKARSMLDLITEDLQRAVFRGDLPAFGTGPATAPTSANGGLTSTGLYYFTATTSTTAFYTRVAGFSSASTAVRNISLVSYVLSGTNDSDKIVLQRSDLAVPWTSSTNIAFQGNMGPLLQNCSPIEVAPGVVGFRLAFRRADGTLIDQAQYTGFNEANPVVAVDVGVAVIGKQSLALLSTQQIQTIQTAFAAATLGTGIKTTWDQQVLTSAFYTSYPTLGNGLKTFERCVACTAF